MPAVMVDCFRQPFQWESLCAFLHRLKRVDQGLVTGVSGAVGVRTICLAWLDGAMREMPLTDCCYGSSSGENSHSVVEYTSTSEQRHRKSKYSGQTPLYGFQQRALRVVDLVVEIILPEGEAWHQTYPEKDARWTTVQGIFGVFLKASSKSNQVNPASDHSTQRRYRLFSPVTQRRFDEALAFPQVEGETSGSRLQRFRRASG